MTVFMFRLRFVEPILQGWKSQTIRQSARCKPEDVLSLRVWTGKPYRSAQREIVPPVECEAVTPIEIVIGDMLQSMRITLGERVLSLTEMREFVQRDGFIDLADFTRYYQENRLGLFSGFLIEWTELYS